MGALDQRTHVIRREWPGLWHAQTRSLRACHRLGVKVLDAFARFQPACAKALGGGPDFDVAAWLSELAGSLAVAELAARSGLSRYAVGRNLRGTTKPKLDDFIALVEAISGRASDLVQELVPIAEVPELLDVARQRAAAKRLAFEEPWSAAMMRVLETSGYQSRGRHEPGFVASRLGLPIEQERAVLAALEAAGVARLRDGRYEVLRRAFREIRAIAAASQPAESVALLNLHLVTWNEE